MGDRRWMAPAIAACLLLTTGARAAEPVGQDAILALEDERFRAMIAGDLPTLDRILADDLTYVHSGGQLESKAEFLGRLRSGDLKYKVMRREDVQVRLLDCAAVVTGRVHVEVYAEGEDRSIVMRFTDVYAQRAGRWRMVAWQSTRIP